MTRATDAATIPLDILLKHVPTALLVAAVLVMSAAAWRAVLDTQGDCFIDDLFAPRACEGLPALTSEAPMKATLYREIEDGDDTREVAIRVEYGIHGRHIPATRVDPEEWPELEVESATRTDTGEEVELTADEEGELWSAADDARQSAAEDAAEARWEARREQRWAP